MNGLRRTSEIAAILSEEGLGLLAVKLGLKRPVQVVGGDIRPDADVAEGELPQRLRRALERLGTMFIKFGQMLSSRHDLLPEAYCTEFAKLRSNVPPFPVEVAIATIEAELGGKLDELFAHFERKPLAAASVGQVHAARLHDGSEVVVKIQRPEAYDTVMADTELLLTLSTQLDRFIPAYKAAQVHAVAEEFTAFSRRELDFRTEADACERFAANLADDEDFRIPKIHRALTSRKVLVMERLEGRTLGSLATVEDIRAFGFDPDHFLDAMLRTILEQSFVHGFVHADLHPGNVFLCPDGRIGLIDFGMFGEIDERTQRTVLRSILYRTSGKYDLAADATIELFEAVRPDADRDRLRQDLMAISTKLARSSVRDYSLGHSFQEEGTAAVKHGFAGAPSLIVLGRAIVTVEGIAIKYAPDVVVVDEMKKVMRTILAKRLDPRHMLHELAASAPELLELAELVPMLQRNVLRWQRGIAEAGSLGEFLAAQGLNGLTSGRPRGRGVGPWLLAAVIWGVGGMLAAGDHAAGFGVLGVAALITLKLVFGDGP